MRVFKNKIVLGVVTGVAAVSIFATGVLASSTYKQITAYQNPGITITVDGKTVDLNSEEGMMYPLIYDGHSYVSARALAEAMGGVVNWNDDTQTVEVTTKGVAVPDKDNTKPAATSKPAATPTPAPTATAKPAATSKPAATTAPASGKSANAGTLSDPVALGKSFTYHQTENYKAEVYGAHSADYTVTVNSVKSITIADAEALGYEYLDAEDKMDYVLLDLTYQVSNAKFTAGSDSDYTYVSLFEPEIWGSKTKSGGGIIGHIKRSFDGAIGSVWYDRDPERLDEGQVGGYTISGKVILPVTPGAENYLVMQNDTTGMDYDASFIYFSLK